MDVLEKPVVDDLTAIEFDENTVEQCTHSQHDSSKNHEGDAVWWQHGTCPNCSYISRGYRCDKFVTSVHAHGGVFCSNCGSIMRICHLTFTPIGD